MMTTTRWMMMVTAAAGLLVGCGADDRAPDSMTAAPTTDMRADTAQDGTPPDMPRALPDAGVEDMASASSCVDDIAERAVLRGGSLWAPLEGVAGAEIIKASGPAGFTAFRDGVLRVPYAETTVSIGLTVGCDDASEHSKRVEIEVEMPTWRPLAAWSGDGGPDAREHPQLWIDPGEPDALYLIGGYGFTPSYLSVRDDIWRYDLVGESWSQIVQTGQWTPRAGGRVAPRDAPGSLLYYGGDRIAGSPVRDWSTLSPADGTWATAGTEGRGAILGALIWDTPRQRHLWLLGYTEATAGGRLSPSDEVLVLRDGRSEVLEVAPGARPSPRYGFAWAHDVEGERVIVVGGAQTPVAGDPVNPADDVWVLDLRTDSWSPMATQGRFSPRRNGCHAYDPENKRLMWWGGTPDAQTGVDELTILEIDTGRVQTPRFAGAPPIRSSCAAIWDAARGRALFGFGNTTQDVFADVWALEL